VLNGVQDDGALERDTLGLSLDVVEGEKDDSTLANSNSNELSRV